MLVQQFCDCTSMTHICRNGKEIRRIYVLTIRGFCLDIVPSQYQSEISFKQNFVTGTLVSVRLPGATFLYNYIYVVLEFIERHVQKTTHSPLCSSKDVRDMMTTATLITLCLSIVFTQYHELSSCHKNTRVRKQKNIVLTPWKQEYQ